MFGTHSMKECWETENVCQIEQFLADMQVCRGVQDEKVLALHFASLCHTKGLNAV